MCFNLLVGVIVDRFSYLPVFLLAALMPLLAASFIFAGVRERRTPSSPV
jgi:predicted MFS family arabinose efflux permease